MNDDPLDEVLNRLSWWDEHVKIAFNSLGDREPYYPNGLYQMTWEIALWCDRGNCSVDPLPMIRAEDLLRRFARPARVISTKEVDGELKSFYGREPRPPRELVESALETSATITWQRIWNVALSMRKSTNGSPDLITRSQVADMVGLEEKSMGPHVKDWPQPIEPARGRKPARWDWRTLYKTVQQQFPEKRLKPPKF